jgi:hypothetical protein
MIPGMNITPLRRADIPELSQFLINNRSDAATSSHLSPEVLSWKYLDGPDGDSDDSTRSLIARSAGKIIGHIGLCHRQWLTPGNGASPISTTHAIDWHCSPAYRGSGALLMLRAFATCNTQYALGGSSQAQALFPRMGFTQKPSVAVFRKILAPFHRIRASGQGLLRMLAGTAKDALSVWRTRRPLVPQPVKLRPAQAFTEEINCLQNGYLSGIAMCRRNHLLLNYFLRCPLSGFSGWTIHTPERMIGFALLRISLHGRVRLGKIVDCCVGSADPCHWHATVNALVDRLRSLSADDVTCYAATTRLHDALLSNGFTKSRELCAFLRDKEQLLPANLVFGLSMLDGDHAIL